MARAISKARRTGLAAVTVRDSGHFGIAGAYVLRALEAGMIGIMLCNADPQVRPTGARVRGTGTNPIAIGAPDGRGRGILLDMATSVVALGKVEVAW
jgi:LDH2 family malate/lactate/ureidoglycolate dehydrogenase